MTEGKKTRAMNVKRFVRGPTKTSKQTTEGFLSAHMEWLRSHSFLDPILDAYEASIIPPTPTLQAIQSALLDHMLLQQSREELEKLEAAEEQGQPEPYTITLMVKTLDPIFFLEKVEVGTVEEVVAYRILTDNGPKWVETQEETDGYHVMEKKVEVGPAVWGAGTFGAAMNLADRKLYAREDSVHAIIQNTQGVAISTQVNRQDAIARILRQPKGAVSRGGTKSTKSLKWQGRAKQDRASFSRG